MRRLFPHPAAGLTVRECYEAPRHRVDGRPWVALCMVSGLDGSTVVEENSRRLSNPVDQEVLLTLRSMVDLVLVGASTVRAEGYGPPRTPGLRIAVVSRTAQLDFSLPLWTSGRAVLVVPERAPDVPVPCIRAGLDDVDLAEALRHLDAESVQAEGGATLNGALAAADLIDELNLTISPQLTGGAGPRLTFGAPPVAHRMDLAHVLEDDGFLFTRWLRQR